MSNLPGIKTLLRKVFFLSSKVVVVLIILAVIFRASLPYIVHRYVNNVLNRLPEYKGSVGDIDIALIRGAYVINHLILKKRNGAVLQPFVDIPMADLSVQWKALFHGKFVGEIELTDPVFNLVNSDSTSGRQLTTKGDWQSMIKDLFPIDINRTAVEHGTITYRHQGTKDEKGITITNVNGEVTGLTNRPDKENILPAVATFNGKMQDTAAIKVKLKLDPLSTKPTFDGDLSSEVLPLTTLNKLLRKTIGIDAEGGTIQVFAEAASKDGAYHGYVKPILRNISLFSPDQDATHPVHLLWEGVIALITEVFTNQKHEQFAAKIPFEGQFDKTEVDIWESLATVVHNAFIHALRAKVDDDVSLKSSAVHAQ